MLTSVVGAFKAPVKDALECLKLGPSQDLMARKGSALTGSKLCKCHMTAMCCDKASSMFLLLFPPT